MRRLKERVILMTILLIVMYTLNTPDTNSSIQSMLADCVDSAVGFAKYVGSELKVTVPYEFSDILRIFESGWGV